MATISPALPTLQSSRLRSFVWPREHGGWGLLLVPLATGAGVSRPGAERAIWILVFAVVALGLFCLRTPVEARLAISPLRPQNEMERRLIHHSIYLYASVTGLALAALLGWARAYGLLWLGAAAAIAFIGQAVWKQGGLEKRRDSQWLGALALTSTAAGAYYLGSGRLDRTAAALWVANWLFAANQIHFVQLRIRSARAGTAAEKLVYGKPFLLHQAALLLILSAAWREGWLPGLAILAFAPVLLRGLAWFVQPARQLAVRRLGATELAYAVLFGIVFIAGYNLSIR